MPPYNVILRDDNDHTYEYVVEMLRKVFGHPEATAYLMAAEVDGTGRVIVWTGSLEVAELKQEQVHSFGADPRIPHCKGSMSADVEPA